MSGLRQTIRESRLYRGALLALILLCLGNATFFLTEGHRYLSPGPVSALDNGRTIAGFNTHAEFEQDCAHCHAPIHCVTDDKCQDCHMEIASERMQADTLHGRLPGTKRCQTCHVEHQGRDARITIMGVANVNHDYLASFSLSRHQIDFDDAPITCDDCHQNGQFKAGAVDCVFCHQANTPDFTGEHVAFYGSDCLTCHDGSGRLANFEHNVAFPLTAGHDTLSCDSCHAQQAFVGTPTDCATCHEQPPIHAERFGLDCARCHSTQAWVPAQLTHHNFLLNHGSEYTLSCQTCHVQTYGVYDCYQCHEHETMIHAHVEVNLQHIPLDNCIACHTTGESGEADVTVNSSAATAVDEQ